MTDRGALGALEGLKSQKLLYVEDDKLTREELASMLEPWVGELRVAVDGGAGLELFKAWRPDIVITDIQMPGMSGLTMSGDIRGIAPDQPIIFLSAYNDVEYLFRAIELGVDHYITKPVSVDRLLNKLAQIADHILAVKERQRNQVLLAQYKHLVDQSAIVCKLDPAGRITYVNGKLREISGFASEELIGREIGFLRHESEPKERAESILAEVSSKGRWSGIIRNRTRDGDVYVVESNLVPIADELGGVTEIVSLEIDVSPLSKANENLLESLGRTDLSLKEQRHFLSEYKRALDLGNCVCVADREHRILSLNGQLESLLGYDSQELTGKPLSQIMPDLSGERCLDEILQNGRDHFANRVVRFHARSGKELRFSVVFVGLRDLAGKVDSVLMICQDITESLRLGQEILDTQRELLYMLGSVVESRSLETSQHVKRVAQVSKFLALKAGLDDATAAMLETAAPMHDVGKVGIRDEVLNKPGKLEASEFEEMKEHCRIGHGILSTMHSPLLAMAASIAREHHERFDGTGYPDGLKGEEISIEARIVSIADVLDALFSSRIYKPAWDEQRVLDYFREQRGKQFDARLVDVFLGHWDVIKSLRDDRANV